MSLKEPWIPASRENPCPICGHGKYKDDGCYFIPPGTICQTIDGRSYASRGIVICVRTYSAQPTKDGRAWVHKLNAGAGMSYRPPPPPQAKRTEPPKIDADRMARSFATAVNPSRLDRLGADLGLSVQVLRELGIGWAGERYCNKCDKRLSAWSFPMMNHAGQLLGFRLRFIPCNHKSSIFGGKEGLFVPQRLLRGPGASSKLFITEGPTDAAALLDLGLDAIGRPSNVGGVALIKDLVRARHAADDPIGQLVIVADGDVPGQSGAKQLAGIVRLLCPIVQIVTPPAGVKDARQWKQSGATAADIERAVWSAPHRTLSVIAR